MKREADGTFNGPDCWLLLLPSQSAVRYGSLSKLGLCRLRLLFILTWLPWRPAKCHSLANKLWWGEEMVCTCLRKKEKEKNEKKAMEVGRILMESLLHTGRMTWAMINPTIKAAQSIFFGYG